MCSITDIQNGGWETEDFDLMFPDSGYIPRLRSVNEEFCLWLLFRVFNEMRPILSAPLTHLFIWKKQVSFSGPQITGRVPELSCATAHDTTSAEVFQNIVVRNHFPLVHQLGFMASMMRIAVFYLLRSMYNVGLLNPAPRGPRSNRFSVLPVDKCKVRRISGWSSLSSSLQFYLIMLKSSYHSSLFILELEKH